MNEADEFFESQRGGYVKAKRPKTSWRPLIKAIWDAVVRALRR